MNRYRIFASTSIAALTLATGAGPASAQEAAPQAARLDEIIVTAQRREENIQKASISIAAVSGEALTARGVTDSQSLNDVVPGLKIAYTGSQVQTFIRGVGDAAANAYTQSSVSLNMDGVYLARSSAFGSVFFDTARVEVLRGPQGTLYGRNSSGGAINIISNAPKLGEFGGNVVVEGGNYNLLRLQGVANIPVTEDLAIRAAVQSVDRDGYLSDGGNDDSSTAVRLRGLWRPTDDFSLLLSGETAKVDGKGYGRVYRPVLFGDPWTSSQDPRITPALFPGLLVRNNNTLKTDYSGFSGEMNWTFSGLTLTVIPALRSTKTDGNIAGDFLFAELDDSKQKSLEARLSGDTDRLKWVVGAYAFKEDMSVLAKTDQRVAATQTGRVQTQDIRQLDTSAWAAFGEATFSLTDALRVIGGLRYTEETRERTGTITDVQFVGGVAAAPTRNNLGPASLDVDAVTWRTGLEYDVAPQNMIYASVSKGFKSGGFDAADLDTYNPEYVTAYTIGSKNRFLSDSLQLNVEGFYWSYKDQQTQFLGQDSNGQINFLTRNAGQATIYGADLDMVWKPTENDSISLGGEYLHAEYDTFRYATVGATAAGVVLADGCISGGPAPGRLGQFIEDCSGKPLPRTPEWSGNARYTHRFDLNDRGDITVGLAAKYQSDHFLQVNYSSPNFRQDAFSTFDADVTYNAPDGKWQLQAYVRNIGEEAVYLSASNSTVTPATGPLRSAVAAIGAPRTYGARLQVNF